MGKQCPQVAEQVIVDIYQLCLRQAASKLTGLLGQVPHPPTHRFSLAAAVHWISYATGTIALATVA